MKRSNGLHFYINVENINQIVLDEETHTGAVNHSIHALDTFFSTIESYGKEKYPNSFNVEKITGGRLHFFVVDKVCSAFEVVKDVSSYAFQVSRIINKEIPKYRTIDDFKIQIGAAYGRFYMFEFTAKDGFSEETSIGYAANFAAKLQALASVSSLTISKDIYEGIMEDDKKLFHKVSDRSLSKYGQDHYYASHLSFLPLEFTNTELTDEIKAYSNRINLSDIKYGSLRKPLNFRDLNVEQCKKLNGIPVFADVRGFTSQFNEDDSNLAEMAERTQCILTSMYTTTTNNGGVHIQFQGDRELSLYHDLPARQENGITIPATLCYKTAVLAAMRLIDAVKPFAAHIGVGEDYGRLFATKIGARNEKDNLLLGETVIMADMMEDKHAGEDQLAITREVYNGLLREDRNLAKLFKENGGYYIATIGFADYVKARESAQLTRNTENKKYNGAWRDL